MCVCEKMNEFRDMRHTDLDKDAGIRIFFQLEALLTISQQIADFIVIDFQKSRTNQKLLAGRGTNACENLATIKKLKEN